MDTKLLLATHNQAKLTELKLGASEFLKDVQILSLHDLQIQEDPEETGNTFEDNAKLKAEFYSQKTGLPTLADDGGLMISYLNNEPGVKSKRWLGYDATDEEMISYALKRLQNAGGDARIARLQTTLVYYNPHLGRDNPRIVPSIYIETESILGHISHAPSKHATHGYPYRAIFIVDQFHKYYDELTPEEHLQINHRLKALKRLAQKIKIDLIK
jgi:XTP/dITP diphosphohydrolase